MYHKTHPATTPNLSSFCRSGPVYCHIKNLITSTIFSNHLLHVPYKKRYKIDTCESTNISFLKARESLECSVLNLALMSYTCSWWYKSTLCVKQWTNGFHICVLHSVTKKIYFCMACLWTQIDIKFLRSLLFQRSTVMVTYVGKTGIWYTCTVSVQLKITYHGICIIMLTSLLFSISIK